MREIRAAQSAEVGEAEHIQAVVDGHDDHVAARGQVGSVIVRRGSGAGDESAAMAARTSPAVYGHR